MVFKFTMLNTQMFNLILGHFSVHCAVKSHGNRFHINTIFMHNADLRVTHKVYLKFTMVNTQI